MQFIYPFFNFGSLTQKSPALGLGWLVLIFVGPSWPISSGTLVKWTLGLIALGPRLANFSPACFGLLIYPHELQTLWVELRNSNFFCFCLRIQTRRPTLLNRTEKNYTVSRIIRWAISSGMLHCLVRKWAIELPERLTWEKLQERTSATSRVNFHLIEKKKKVLISTGIINKLWADFCQF